MKTKIILLAFLTLLVACKDGNDTRPSVAATDVVQQEKTPVTPDIETTAGTIQDMFLLLPDDAFPMQDVSVAQRKLLLNQIGADSAYAISATPIDVYDPDNRYLSLTGMQYGWEMSYWNLADGRKLVAVNNDTETGSEIRVFFYQNGTLAEDQSYQLGGNQVYQLTDFIDLELLSPSTQTFAQQQFAKGDYSLYYQLPREGTALKISLDTDRLLDYDEANEIPYRAMKELTLQWNNEKWER